MRFGAWFTHELVVQYPGSHGADRRIQVCDMGFIHPIRFWSSVKSTNTKHLQLTVSSIKWVVILLLASFQIKQDLFSIIYDILPNDLTKGKDYHLINQQRKQSVQPYVHKSSLVQDGLDTKAMSCSWYHIIERRVFFLGQRVYINFLPLSN